MVLLCYLFDDFVKCHGNTSVNGLVKQL